MVPVSIASSFHMCKTACDQQKLQYNNHKYHLQEKGGLIKDNLKRSECDRTDPIQWPQ